MVADRFHLSKRSPAEIAQQQRFTICHALPTTTPVGHDRRKDEALMYLPPLQDPAWPPTPPSELLPMAESGANCLGRQAVPLAL